MIRFLFKITALLTYFISFVFAGVPSVVVSIPPIHSLVAGVMEGVGTPQLLMDGTESPHTYHLKPGDIQALQSAQLIIWIGSVYESHWEKPIRNLSSTKTILELIKTEGLHLYPNRSGGMWEEHNHEHSASEDSHSHNHHHSEHDHESLSQDGHIWLDPRNCKVLVAKIAQTLATLDPQHASNYMANSQKVIERLNALDQQLWKDLEPVRNRPYLVFHDATQYFDRHYKTRAIGSITIDPEVSPGAERLLVIKSKIQEGHVDCIFSEPQFNTRAVKVLIESTKTKSATLDYMGSNLEPGPDLYFEMMRQFANTLIKELSPK
jgi:zinc transport system substrate-binding protein